MASSQTWRELFHGLRDAVTIVLRLTMTPARGSVYGADVEACVVDCN
jgi:hypothetical protein